jgi:plastocyanin
MKKLMLVTALICLATPALAKEYIVKEISDPADGEYIFSPDNLTIQPGDTVTFVNDQNDDHDVMFVNVPNAVDEMIMSPMLKKEGEKWSYTFNISGTYQFHCHPHERKGMKGTLIVGQPSNPGETKIMDHHKLAANLETGVSSVAVPSSLTHGTGTIDSIDAANHTIKINHEAIQSLGWPKMKMTFTVDPTVDLSRVTTGDTVSFTLKSMGNDDYIISGLKKNQ